MSSNITGTIHAENKIRILLVYAMRPLFGRITIPEWIKEALREHYFETVDVYACGPNNEIDIQDSHDFYLQVENVVQQHKVDVVWDIDGWVLSEDFMFKRYPDLVTVPRVYWAIDTHQFLGHQKEKAGHFDLVFSAMKNAVEVLGDHARWLPVGASIHEVDYKLERTIDVGFIGNCYPGLHDRRIRILERVQTEFPEFQWHSNVFLADKAKLVSRMKIMLNISLNNDINLRVFETLACGALLITDRIHNNGMESLFEDGKHLVLFDDEQDLIRKIRYYLAHEDERTAIALAGQKHVLERMTHKSIIGYAFEAILPLVENHRKTRQHPTNIRQCWCKAALVPSVHPQYNVCSGCGSFVSVVSTTPEELSKFYSFDGYWREYQEQLAGYPPIHVRAVTDFSDRIPFWYGLVEKYGGNPNSMLEIGCSHGGFLSYCQQHGIQNIVGVEVDEDTCRFAKNHFNLPHVVSGLFPDVELPFSVFDLITGFDVIEHFANPVEDLQAVCQLLSIDGSFIFQTPCYRGENSAWQQFKPIEHLYLYNEYNVKDLFSRAGLEITTILPGYFIDDMFVVGRKKRNEQILFLRTDAIGDNVLASSMLPHIKSKYPDATLTIVCQDRVAPLYIECPYVDNIIDYNLWQLFNSEECRNSTVAKINDINPTLLINTVFSRDNQNYYLSLNCNAPVRIACEGDTSNISPESKVEFDKNFSHLIPNDPKNKTELSKHRHLLQQLGIFAPELMPQVWISKNDECLAEELFHRLGIVQENTIVLFPGAQMDFKIYPHFKRVIQSLSNYDLILLGDAQTSDYFDELFHGFSGRAYNLAGMTTLPQLAAIMRRARLYIGVDTSGAHIACAVGLPNVVILGGGHFGRFLPYSPLTTVVSYLLECHNCNWQCKYDRCHCVQDIRPDLVINAIKHALTRKSVLPRVCLQTQSFYSDCPPLLYYNELGKLLDLGSVEIVEE
ncbi:MAG: glycosyltransferase [Desulfuromonadaceae bacterium]|nr:glycosyltransferase [Desulfuromonadaceae bacterium]